MKTRLVSVAMIIALGVSTLQARGDDDRHNRHHDHYTPPSHHQMVRHHHSDARWIVPLVVGGVIGYAISRPEPTRVVAYNAPTYREEWVYSQDCDCKRRVLVEIR